jgi:Flp pilus assembly protein TadG
MFGSIRKFAKDRRGAFAMQFALMAVPLCVCTGLAIDGGRAFLARFELASALDAAALAVGSTTTEGADLSAVAKKYVDINFKTEHDKPIALTLDVGEERATLKGSVEINTYFMPLVGQPTVTVSAESEVRVGGNNVEVAMALDVTGSMAGTRISGLQESAKILIDEVVGTVQTPYFSKVAIVPWSQSVYVGTKHVNASTVTDLRGTPTPATPITGATWRAGSAGTQAITSAGWRTSVGGKTVSAVAWKNGAAQTITKITKASSKIGVTTSANHGYANGDFVRVTGATGSYTILNNSIYVVADVASKTFNLKTTAGVYVTPPSGSTDSTAGSSQRCYDALCNVAVTPSASLGVAVGDWVRITGVNGFTAVNNGTDQSWVVAALVPATNAFTITGISGPSNSQTFSTSSSSVSSKCFLVDCKFQITSGTHGLSTGDYAYVWGATVPGSGNVGSTSMNNGVDSSWTVTKISTTQVTLPGSGYSYKDWTSGGSIARCLNATCNVEVTSANHGIANGARVEIANVGTLTGINNSGTNSSTYKTWVTTYLSANSLRLNGSTPALSFLTGTYSSNTGTVQCLSYGCAKLSMASNSTTTPYQATPCLVERYGADAATDVSPATTPLGILYSSNGACTTTNYVTPMTADRTRLNTSIDDLKTGGSTAGQIGIAWAWYMLSPNFKDVWDKEAANQPKDYTTKELVKVAVLMTDGEFNYSTCSGVAAGTLCTPATDEFAQAEAICQAMKDQNITIYTVGLGIDTSLYADDFLIKCASKPSYAFLAADTAELKVAFKKVATSISKLRISK